MRELDPNTTVGGTPHTHSIRLTGRMRIRSSWTGRPIAQVEEVHETRRMFGDPLISRWLIWRDACRADLVTEPSQAAGGAHA